MDEPAITPTRKSSARRPIPVLEKVVRYFLSAELSKWGFFAVVLTGSLFLAYAIVRFGATPGVLLIALLIGLPIIFGIVFYPKFGILTLIVASYFIMLPYKFDLTTFPLGTLMDFIQLLLILGIFFQKRRPNITQLYRSPISMMILVWIIYNLLQVLNPYAASKMAWLYTVRSVALVMLLYFVYIYNIQTKEFIRTILKWWLALSFLAALYGMKQEFFGFAGFEKKYLDSNIHVSRLLFIRGHWRKFSFFNDPVVFAYNMVSTCLLCVGLMTGPVSRAKKLILATIFTICFFGMMYTGTRGAFVLLPAAFVLILILRFNSRMMAAAVVAALVFVFLIYVPTSNYTILRFQTAFRPSDDASFNLRKANQKKIQPYILSHPIGGGLGATGVWGSRFAPNSFLASFPPDSGYVRVAVELGWIGLFLFCLLVFVILRTGVIHYFAIRDPELKAYCLSMILIVFALQLGNYPQEALVQYPTSVLFYLVIALIVITKKLDEAKPEDVKR